MDYTFSLLCKNFVLEHSHQFVQIFCLFYTKKPTFSILQNIHISLSILHIYSIKYSLFYNFLLFTSSLPLSLTDPQPPSSPPSHHHHHHQKPKAIKSEIGLQTRRLKLHQNPPNLHPKSKKNQHKINQHKEKSTPIKMPSSPRLHTYPDQPTTQINPNQANPHKPRPTHTINLD